MIILIAALAGSTGIPVHLLAAALIPAGQPFAGMITREHYTRRPAKKTFPADGENVCTFRAGHNVPHRWMNRAVFQEGERDGR